MSGFDIGNIYYQDVLPATESGDLDRSHTEATKKFIEFVREFRLENNYIYR
jgi:hypothetical protein